MRFSLLREVHEVQLAVVRCLLQLVLQLSLRVCREDAVVRRAFTRLVDHDKALYLC